VVDVDQREGERPFVARGAGELFLEAAEHRPPIRQVGERIRVGDPLERRRHLAHLHPQQAESGGDRHDHLRDREERDRQIAALAIVGGADGKPQDPDPGRPDGHRKNERPGQEASGRAGVGRGIAQ
jgi:hypothetical protein